MNKLLEPGQSPEMALQAFRTLAMKYESMLDSLRTRHQRISEKMREIEKSIDAVSQISKATESSVVDYELGETLFARATVPAGAKVNLWLGANVLLEYEPEEALALLKKKLEDSQAALDRVKHDESFTREQLTTMEVNVARVYNLIVEFKQAKK